MSVNPYTFALTDVAQKYIFLYLFATINKVTPFCNDPLFNKALCTLLPLVIPDNACKHNNGGLFKVNSCPTHDIAVKLWNRVY